MVGLVFRRGSDHDLKCETFFAPECAENGIERPIKTGKVLKELIGLIYLPPPMLHA